MTQDTPNDTKSNPVQSSPVHDSGNSADEDFRLLAESAHDFAMILTDVEWHVVRWSDGAEHVLGWTEDEAQARAESERDFIFTPEDRTADVPQQERETALRDGRAEDERWHLKKDGSRFWASGVMTPLYDPETGALRGFGKVLRDLTERRQLEEHLIKANETLEARVSERTTAFVQLIEAQHANERTQAQESARLLIAGAEEERRRISRELHDQTGQHLTGLALQMSVLERSADATREAARAAAKVASLAAAAASDAARAAEAAAAVAAEIGATPEASRLARVAAEAARTAAITSTDAGAAAAAADAALAVVDQDAPNMSHLRQMIKALSEDIHRIAVDLRPTSLDDLGLVASLRGYAEEWEQRTGIEADVQSFGLEEAGDSAHRLPSEIETTLYRIVQEALTNIARHAVGKATCVNITLQRINGHVQATIEDDGPGFDPQTVGAGRLGLAGMQERATLLGGTLEVESTPGKGTTVFARLPV